MSEELVRFLKSASIPTEGNNLLTTLENLGVEKLDDLEFLEGGDLEDSGLTVIQRRKLLQKVKQLVEKGNGHSAIPQTEAGSIQSVPPVNGARYGPVGAQSYSLPLEQIPAAQPVQPGLFTHAVSSARGPPMSHEPIPTVGSARIPSKCQISYIFCSGDLFTVNCMKRPLYIDLEKDSMEFLANLILTNESLPQDSTSIELFTHEGYPIVLNDYNRKVPLKMWELSNDALFYALSRPKLQPFWTSDEEEFTFVDPCHGKNKLLIYSAFHCGLPINVDLPCPVDVIVNKVATCTNMAARNISLHKTPKDTQKLTDEDVLFLQDGDTLIIRLNSKFKRGNDYGKKTYTPMIRQTDHGISKFYSILKYLVHQRTVCPLIVQFLHQHTSFPPLAYAFHLFQREHYIINLPHAVALFEGFYCLFSSLLKNFCTIPEDEVMEYSDYVFGLILKLTKDQKQTEISEHSMEYLTCPITDQRILRPVALPSSDRVYEKLAVENIIKDNGVVVYCEAEGLQYGDIMPSQRHQRLLMLSDYDQASSFCIWKTSPSPQACIPAVAATCNWEELATSHKELNVCDPDALAGKNNVLTYLNDGRMVLFTSPLKSADLDKQVYDPLTGDVKSYTVSKMESFKSSGVKKVFRDIKQCLNPKIRGSTSTESIADPSLAVKKKQEVGEITREPEEAIMIMLDTSGSMDESIFMEEGGVTKLSAAREYFHSFSNRIEAYGLPQVVGLISFSNTNKLEIPFTEVMDQFKNVLGSLTSGGGTALYNATLVAVENLKEFTKNYPLCKRRILCLTDGHDNSSTKPHEVVAVLQREKVVVDTILVTDRHGNVSQKALCHATGGYCFLPDSRPVAYRLFEMEALLTLKDRHSSQPVSPVTSQGDFDKFRNLKNFPYNSTDPYDYKSQFAVGLDDHTYCSARSMVQRAQIIGFATAASGSTSSHHVRRLLQEIKHYQNNPHPKVEIFPGQSNVSVWKVLLQAPEGTPYEGGTYLLCAKFPGSYPSEPPEFRFITPIYHCNINSSGRICHPVLGRNYLPSMSMREIFDHVFGLLMAPEPLDPLDSMLASEYHHSRIEYELNARKHAKKYAMKVSLDDLKKELTKDEDTDVDDSLVCPLTHKVYVDPVTTQYGYIYERAALMKYMAENNNMDPQAKKPIARERIVSVEAVKKMADLYRKAKMQT